MSAEVNAAAVEVVERLHQSMNEHDLGAFVACFDPGYRSEQPAHPNRGFDGRDQVERTGRCSSTASLTATPNR
jgi:hypothetical protein